MMKAALLLCVLALVATGAHARASLKRDDPASFRVLDKINGILEKELNMLDGGDNQVALRGSAANAMTFVSVQGKWPSFKAGAASAYQALKAAAGKKLKWAKGKIKGHPYKWLAFKAATMIVTAIFCPACALAFGIAFAVIDSAVALSDLKEAKDDLPADLTDEAKAACLAVDTTKTLIVVTAAAVNIFIPIPLDIAGGAAEGAKAALGLVDWNSVFSAGGDPAAAAMTKIATDSATGAAGQATDDKASAAINKIKEKNGKMAKLTCSEAAKLADEAAHANSETEEGGEAF